MDKLEIALDFLREINNLGYKAYLVGGASRDHLLGRSINDVDITTNMPIELLNEAYPVNSKVANKFLGTKLIYKGLELEVTHFRRELSYKDHRHPLVKLAYSLDEDLKRRDFTINALAMASDGHIYDNYNGLYDLDKGIIRTIGRPTRRFNEDALRILRGIYFSLKLNFKIEAKTMRAMRNRAFLLAKLQTLTILEELLKIMALGNPNTFRVLRKIGLKQNLSYLKASLYYLEKYNYYPKNLLEFIYLISYFNGELLNVNIKRDWKKRILKALALKKANQSLNEILSLLEKGEEDV